MTSGLAPATPSTSSCETRDSRPHELALGNEVPVGADIELVDASETHVLPQALSAHFSKQMIEP